MKTPSAYPVLDNRPIDQWKVAELKEELKKRKLTIKGLKDDLVRRLAEALRDEHDIVKENNDNNDFHAIPQSVVHDDEESDLVDTPQPNVPSEDIGLLDNNADVDAQTVVYHVDTPQPVVHDDEESDLVDTPQPKVPSEDIGLLDNNADVDAQTVVYQKNENLTTHDNNAEIFEHNVPGKNEESVVIVTSAETNIVVNEALPEIENFQDEEVISSAELVENEESLNCVTTVETSVTVTESITHEVATDVKESLEDVFGSVGDDSKTQFESQESEPSQNAKVAKPLQDDVKLDSSDPSNQVSEVNTVLGFQVKSDSISSDTLSINEKNELKDNIIDDNVNLELDLKPEVASSVISDGSEPHPMDVEDLCDKKEPVDEGEANLEMSKKNDSLDVGSSEKLNLDRSSGDDSMDDETIETKPIDSKYNSERGVDEGENFEETLMEEAPAIMSKDVIAEKNDVVDEIKNVSAAPIGKRKLNDQEVVGNNETSKRQRRWNTGTVKVPESQTNTTSSVTPKDTFPTTALKRNFTRSDSTASEEAPKERVVPPSPKSPTTSLKIDRFLRPFTLKAVQELLGKTGSVTSFWMDHIKTHCYVTYSSVEEAVETRNAVYNLQWPPNGGRLLLAEFVDPQEVKTRTDAPPPSPVTPVATMPPPPPTTGQPPRQQRQQALPPPPPLPLPPPPPLSNPAQARERLPPPPPMEKTELIDTPIVTLDDLFRKTKTTPRIYYLPLTDEQVAAKRRNMRQ